MTISQILVLSLTRLSPLSKFYFYYFTNNNNNKALPRFKYCNSRSPLPFPNDLSLITYVRALPD
ncbi:hypothetical protein HanRHA438_Chr16g0746521 [Helianthus annuus]|nr:hypothetical protein HanRHA438_Chr16g0746521 [Helianthus annuus]